MCTRSKQANIVLVILFFIIFIILSLIAFSAFEVPDEEPLKGECRKNEFNCKKNEPSLTPICIPKEKVCDTFYDCPEGEDEVEDKCDFSYLEDFFENFFNKSKTTTEKSVDVTYIINSSNLTDDPFDTTTFESISNNSNSTDSPFKSLTSTMSPNIPSPESSLNSTAIYSATCQPKTQCDFEHSLSVCCNNQQIKSIPIKLAPTIRVLQMNKNNLTFLNEDSFKNLTSLHVISLEYNQIERLDFNTFYSMRKLKRIFLGNNHLTSLPVELFRNLTELRYMELRNNRLSGLNLSMFDQLDNLFKLDLSFNHINLNGDEFPYLPKLSFLHLASNRIEKIDKKTFRNLPNLSILELMNNKIVTISPDSFARNFELAHIFLNENQLGDLQMSSQLFRPLSNLKTLNLSYNLFNNLPQDMFYFNLELYELSLQGLPIYNLSKMHFERLKKLNKIFFPHFRYCMFISAELEIICRPFTDQVSSYSSLLALPSLKVMVWSISILIILLNFMVLFLRSIENTKHRVLCAYVKLLSVSDLLIGFYMLAIGLLDVRFGKSYHAMALNFAESWLCTGLGVLGVFSKQFSLFIVLLISYDRNRSVTQDFFQLPTIYSLILVLIGFLLSSMIALFPVLFWSHSNHNNIYFSANLLCYPLHLAEPFLLGYQFNAVVNIFFNLPIVLIIIFLYAHMYFRIKKSREGSRPIFNLNVSKTNIATASNQSEQQLNSTNSSSFKYVPNPSASKLQSNVNLVIKNTNDNQEDRKLAMRFFFIVATDCICWLPVIIIKIAALLNFGIPGLLNAWIIIVILPINCILNPIIYTIVAPKHLSKLLATTCSLLKMKLMNIFKLNATKRGSNVRQSSDSGDFRTSSGSNLNSINQHALNSPLSSSQITMQCLDRKSSNEQEKFCESYLDLNNNNNNENLMSISQSLIKSSTTNV